MTVPVAQVIIRAADAEATAELILTMRAVVDTLEGGDMTPAEAAGVLREALDRFELEGA